jgi:hypothetical protein
VVRREADRARIGRDVGKSQRLPFFDQRAQDAAAVRGGADRFTLLGGDAGGDELHEIAVRADDAKGPVPGVGDLDRKLDDALEYGFQ